MMLADRRRYAITVENLDKAFPEKLMSWKHSTARAAYTNLGLVFTEIAAFPKISDDEIKQSVEYENIELLREKYLENRGLILLSGHFGNWEWLAYSAGLFADIPITIVVKPQRNRRITELLNNNRRRAGNNVVQFDKAAKTIISTLKNGGAIALLADQAADAERDVFIDFFGRPAAVYEAPAALALRLNVPIIMGFAVRQSNSKYRVRLMEIPHKDLQYSPEDVAELTRRHTAALETAIREHPELWAWQHKRWKYKPKQNYTESGGKIR
ncbi:lysophospholipid acyltransferase family protein [Ignavibacteria bacterium]